VGCLLVNNRCETLLLLLLLLHCAQHVSLYDESTSSWAKLNHTIRASQLETKLV
jgi:hypothetical protein